MRLALVTSYPPSRGSLNEYAFHFVNHLRQKPEIEEVIIIADQLPAGTPEDSFSAQGARLSIDRAWQFGKADNALRIRRAVQRHQPDAVLFNIQFASFADSRLAGALGLTAPRLVKQAGYLTLVLLHNIMEVVDLGKAGFGGNPLMERLTRLAGNLFTRLLLSADLVAVTIPKYVEILEAKYKAQNVFLAPHGAFEVPPLPNFDVPTQPYQIMTFGKFGTYKRVEALVEAFDILQKEQKYPLELVIAGTDSPNAKGYLESVRQRYPHVPQVRYTGYVAEEDVPHIFQEAAVVVFPYNSTTGSSGVLHQAGSYGKAVTLPRLGDFIELIEEEGYVGESFVPDEPVSMAKAIARYLDDPAYRQHCGRMNYQASVGLPMDEIVDWYLLHIASLRHQRT